MVACKTDLVFTLTPTHCHQTQHKRSCRIHILHLVDGRRADDVVDSDDVLMLEAQKDLDLSQGALAVRLVFKGADLLNGHADLVVPVVGRAETQKPTVKRSNILFKR